jgi:Protein of unknown function (DUF5663)
MFQLDDQFLQSIGLGDLPQEQKEAFLQHTYETLEERVGTRLANGLGEAQLQEFEGFASQDEARTYTWLNANVPGYADQEDYKRLAATAPEGTSLLAIAAEYASVRWLEINSPNYRQVVSEELTRLRDEIIASRDQISGSATAPAPDHPQQPPVV